MTNLRVNPATMCFENMTAHDVIEIKKIAREIVVTGNINWENKYVKMWLNVCSHTENQKLLLASTALPQRFFLSITGGFEL